MKNEHITTLENTYWRDNFVSRPYVDPDAQFDDYGPAYDYGVESSAKYEGRDFDDVESDLSSSWEAIRGKSSLAWEHARHAVRDAWNRVRNMV